MTGGLVLLLISITDDRKYTIDIMSGGYGILQEIMQNVISTTGLGIILLVADKDNQYYGIVMLNDIRKLLFDVSKYESVKIRDIMITTPEIVHIEDRMEQVMNKLEKTKTWNLPVIDDHKRYVGMVSQSTLFYFYRNQLLYQTET